MTDDMIIKAIENTYDLWLDRNLTQEQLGERSGVPRTTIRDLELEKRSIPADTASIASHWTSYKLKQNFWVRPELNSLELAKLEMEKRRASGSRSNQQNLKRPTGND